MEDFREAIAESGLSDLGYRGSRYTWNNGRDDAGFTKARLDHVLANRDWCSTFSNVVVRALAARSFDHKPLLIEVGQVLKSSRPGIFRFEASWVLEHDFQNIVGTAWDSDTHASGNFGRLRDKLSQCSRALTNWSRGKTRHGERSIKALTAKLEALQRHEEPANRDTIRDIQGRIEKMLEQEDLKWRQRSKQAWYQKGDRNTPNFHAWASQCRRQNRIECIKDEDGREWETEADIREAFTTYFQQIFTTGEKGDMSDILEGLDGWVTMEMNSRLLAEFTTEEVDAALKQMHPPKSLGPDGFAVGFYQSSWPIVGR